MNDSVRDELQKILSDWIDSCKKEWRENFVSAIQFGSTTKSYIKIETDVDLLLVFNKVPKNKWDRFQFIKNKELELENNLKKIKNYNLLPSILCWQKESFEKLHPLYLDFVDSSNILYDPDSIARNIINKTEDWLKKRGAIKVQKGHLWYWDVNPNRDPTFSWSFDEC
jgi:predicted nucleotidyltransferase